jgi:hypothetical protein
MLENLFALVLMPFRYAAFAVVSIAANVLVWLLSPVLALMVVVEPWDGAPREFLPRWCRWLQTHDNPLDAWWRDGYYKDAFDWSAKLTDADFEQSAWLRYVARMCWLQRNPAYGLATYALGYRKTKEYKKAQTKRGEWDTASTNMELVVCKCDDSPLWQRWAFLFHAQLYYTRTRYVRIQMGWKLQRDEPKVMLATHFNPFRKWAST